MRRGTLVDPILFGVAHAAPTLDYPLPTGPVQRTALRTVAERLCAIAPHGRVPVVHDYLDCHRAAPDAYGALRTVGSRIKATMAAGPVDGQIWWNPQRRRTTAALLCYPLVDRELADLVELDHLEARIRDWMAFPTHHKIDLKSVLRVRSFAETNPEPTLLVTNRPVDPECVAEVGVTAFVEGSCEAYPGLNRREPSVPWDLRDHDVRSETMQFVPSSIRRGYAAMRAGKFAD